MLGFLKSAWFWVAAVVVVIFLLLAKSHKAAVETVYTQGDTANIGGTNIGAGNAADTPISPPIASNDNAIITALQNASNNSALTAKAAIASGVQVPTLETFLANVGLGQQVTLDYNPTGQVTSFTKTNAANQNLSLAEQAVQNTVSVAEQVRQDLIKANAAIPTSSAITSVIANLPGSLATVVATPVVAPVATPVAVAAPPPPPAPVSLFDDPNWRIKHPARAAAYLAAYNQALIVRKLPQSTAIAWGRAAALKVPPARAA